MRLYRSRVADYGLLWRLLQTLEYGVQYWLSPGYRDGTVQKISQKGFIYKTYEGEMILGGLTSGVNGAEGTFNRERFKFTVSDPEVVKQINDLPAGKKVRLHYRQGYTKWTPNGDTQYFITKVEDVK